MSTTQATVSKKLERLRLARECAKLDPAEERAAAAEVLVGEVEWPDYPTERQTRRGGAGGRGV